MSDNPSQPEPADALTGMWKGSSDVLALSDRVDGTRADLLDEFDRDPLGRHDLELQLTVSGVRGSARIPRFALARIDHGRWQVVRTSGRRGGPLHAVSPRVFDDLRDAERYVFGLRLQLLSELDSPAEGRAS